MNIYASNTTTQLFVFTLCYLLVAHFLKQSPHIFK
nr:MAG TPA: hypothetical protein [Bacteriophage sp.]